jgi:hypothetical protein
MVVKPRKFLICMEHFFSIEGACLDTVLQEIGMVSLIYVFFMHKFSTVSWLSW